MSEEFKTLSDFRQLDQDLWTYEEEHVKEAIKKLGGYIYQIQLISGYEEIDPIFQDIYLGIKKIFGEALTE